MSVIVSDANTGARRLYEGFGYREFARRTMIKEDWVNEGQEWVLLTSFRRTPCLLSIMASCRQSWPLDGSAPTVRIAPARVGCSPRPARHAAALRGYCQIRELPAHPSERSDWIQLIKTRGGHTSRTIQKLPENQAAPSHTTDLCYAVGGKSEREGSRYVACDEADLGPP
jgi:hypothetical protein